MSVSYKVVAKGKPGVEGGGEIKYYASIVRGKKLGLRSFVEEIAQMNTLQTPDVFAVLESFLQMSAKHLSEGRAIDMGQLGTFSPAIQSRGEVTPKDVNRNSIVRLKVNFRPSSLLSERLSVAKFEKVKNGSISQEEPEGEG